MAELEQRHFRVSDVAHAIEVTPKALRNWLQRSGIEPQAESPDSWRAFSHYDVALCALVRPMVTFGIPAKTAHTIADDVLRPALRATASREKLASRVGAANLFDGMIGNTYLSIWWSDKDGSYGYESKDDPADCTMPAYIMLDVGRLVWRAFDRLGALRRGE